MIDIPSNEWRELYDSVNVIMAVIGCHGTICAKDDRVLAVMDALAEIDGGSYQEKS